MGNKAIYRHTPGGSSGTCWVIMLPRINQGFKSTRGSHTLRSFRSWLRSTTASLVAAAVSPAVGAARRLADSMAGAAEKDCFECRVIGTSVCMGASRTTEGTPSSRMRDADSLFPRLLSSSSQGPARRYHTSCGQARLDQLLIDT